ncbi:Hpt domain-containing protein [Sulfitobacter aestuariivivens]|uniref:Hpt domain-containing protein n=1 Tax=Sulfitobacter aestuariivivens TaxID=2766981 RepID=A0A927D1C1_9RHOB|nr:Hpt domain-containing protein [Sulfitobacter aestuariivivens]MBD3662601.1 Hpt domain-containing protein [Sulfitobacter aestuariivivens]
MEGVLAMPGLERVREKFLGLLAERRSAIALHTLAALDAHSPAETEAELLEAQNILHKIAGTAGSLGFDTLGNEARASEEAIIATLQNFSSANLLPLIEQLDVFVGMCGDLLTVKSDRTG